MREKREPSHGRPTCSEPPSCWRRPRSPTMNRCRELNTEMVLETRLPSTAGSE